MVGSSWTRQSKIDGPLAIGQWNGERDAELLADAPGDVPVAGQIFGHQDIAGGEPSLGTVSRLKFRQS